MKAPPMPTVEYQVKKIVQKQENTVIAFIVYDTFTISTETKQHKKISAFYSGLNERFIKWCENSFENYAKEVYSADGDRRKRYRYVPLELKYLSKAWQGKSNTLEVKISLTLSKGKNILSEKNFKHIWSLKNGTIIPQKINRRSASS